MRYFLALVLLSLLASCATRRPSMEAPRPARHSYHHRQRVNHRARARRYPRPFFSWQKR